MKRHRRVTDIEINERPKCLSTLGATIAAMMVTPLTAIGQTNESDIQTLNQVEVRAQAQSDLEINRYNVKVTKAAKFEQDVAEVPQAITIIPDTLMVDQNLC